MKRERPIVAIDGPVGAGKSTVARALAQSLGFSYLNTGAMYRAVAVAARAAGISPEGRSAEVGSCAPDAAERVGRVSSSTPDGDDAGLAEGLSAGAGSGASAVA